MKKVSVRTAQNVVIDLRIAPLGNRILSFFIDLTIIGISTLVLAMIFGPVNVNIIYFLPLIFILYTPFSEIFMNGQSLGKKVMRMRVVNVNGKEPQTIDFIIRWVFRLVDIFLTLGSLAVIFVSTTPRGQRLGGILSNTMVISLKEEMKLSLHDILEIEDRDSYRPQYSGVYRFSEEDMLTVKTVIDRYQKYHNPAHTHLVQQAAQQVAGVLDISPPDDEIKFLKTVLRDYVVTTRS